MIRNNIPVMKKEIFSYNSYKAFATEVLLSRHELYPPEKHEQIKINLHRMNRVEKQIQLDMDIRERLQDIDEPQIWLLIAEPWCIDSAYSLPVMSKMVSENPFINLYIVLRDQYQPVIDKYLTNGTRSIPKLIIFNNNIEIGTWGPKPCNIKIELQKMKDKNPLISKSELHAKAVHLYNHDKGISIQREITHILDPYYEPELILCS
jgi:hypothetical protein